MKGIEITYDQAVELLQRAVNEKGSDYIYPRAGAACFYFEDDGSPSCITGHVLHYLGFTKADLPDHVSNDSACNSLFFRVLLLADKTKTLLIKAQVFQDDGVPWGQAVERAVALANEEVLA